MNSLPHDLVLFTTSFLDAQSALALCYSNRSFSQSSLGRDSLIWQSMFSLPGYLPIIISDTARLISGSTIHPLNYRPLLAAISKKGGFSKLKIIRERLGLGRYSKALCPKQKRSFEVRDAKRFKQLDGSGTPIRTQVVDYNRSIVLTRQGNPDSLRVFSRILNR